MFDLSEISDNSEFFEDINKILSNNKAKSTNDIILKENENDIPFLLLPENKLIEIEINLKGKLETNYIKEKIKNKDLNKKDKKIKFILQKENIENLEKIENNNNYFIYRKDAYYKHFKSIFAKYVINKVNKLKNICFPNYNKNNFFPISYKYTGNPKEKDNYIFLSFKIKELLIFGKDEKIKNRQYNNKTLIIFLENNEDKTKDKEAYYELINFLNESVENELFKFYKNKEEMKNINKDSKCLLFDKYFKNETGISLLENNGFIKILKDKYQ
jgi:hypothetical protein